MTTRLTDSDAHQRAAEIAAARKDVLLVGPPGCGKAMIGRRVVDHLPKLTDLERTWIVVEHDAGLTSWPQDINVMTMQTIVNGYLEPLFLRGRPFRAPHYTVSAAGLCGAVERRHEVFCASLRERAGRCDCNRERFSRAGEVRLARFGVLFLDEVTEFATSALLRLVEELARMGETRPLVVATALSCPCGCRGSSHRAALCSCSSEVIARHERRIAEVALILGLEVRS